MQADLTCLGKIIGGGLPVGAYGGRADLMRHVAPLGGVYQAGTLSGNPLGCRRRARRPCKRCARTVTPIGAGAARGPARGGDAARRREGRSAVTVNRVGSMLTGFFTASPVHDYAAARRSDTGRYARFFHAMLERGVYFAPSQFEAAFVSLAHTESDLDTVERAAAEALA